MTQLNYARVWEWLTGYLTFLIGPLFIFLFAAAAFVWVYWVLLRWMRR